MPRYKLIIEYDGKAYNGWQIQPNQPTLQAVIEKALTIACRKEIGILGSGRTDTGVHARGQIAHFDTEVEVDELKLLRSLNGLLPKDIVIRDLELVSDTFHARFDATKRRYNYYVCTIPTALEQNFRWFIRPVPDFSLMNEAGKLLLGEHHFGAFCRTQSATKNRVCTLYQATWKQETLEAHWHFEIIGNRFLHGMVRAIVGTLLDIGWGKMPLSTLDQILASQDRTFAGQAAPAHGLVLEEVVY